MALVSSGRRLEPERGVWRSEAWRLDERVVSKGVLVMGGERCVVAMMLLKGPNIDPRRVDIVVMRLLHTVHEGGWGEDGRGTGRTSSRRDEMSEQPGRRRRRGG